jgi:hypothetical protein
MSVISTTRDRVALPNGRARRGLYPRLNHLFLEGDGVSMPAEYDRPGRIPTQVLDDIAAWLQTASATRAR